MSKPHHDLAARFRTSVQQKEDREQMSRVRAEQEEEDALRARDALLVTLEEFADEARFFEISRAGDRLLLRYEGQSLRFEPDRASADVLVRCSALREECRLEYLPSRQAWQAAFITRNRRTAFDLFPQGLEVLISRCFAIRPASSAPTRREPNQKDEAPPTERRTGRFFR